MPSAQGLACRESFRDGGGLNTLKVRSLYGLPCVDSYRHRGTPMAYPAFRNVSERFETAWNGSGVPDPLHTGDLC